jgi:hypothetical protein
VGGWLAIGVAGVGAGILLRRSSLFGGGDAELDEAAAELDPNAGYLVGPTLVSGGRGGVGSESDARPPSGLPETNQAWARMAVAWLIATGITPTLADTAVRRYLEGLPLDQSQARAIDLVLASPVGVPPEGVPPATTPPLPSPIPNPTTPTPSPNPPTAKPPPAPARVRGVDGGRAVVGVSWTRVPGATKYRVRVETKGRTYPWVSAGNGTTWLMHHRLTRSATIAVRVQAGNASGWGGSRNSAPFTMRP